MSFAISLVEGTAGRLYPLFAIVLLEFYTPFFVLDAPRAVCLLSFAKDHNVATGLQPLERLTNRLCVYRLYVATAPPLLLRT